MKITRINPPVKNLNSDADMSIGEFIQENDRYGTGRIAIAALFAGGCGIAGLVWDYKRRLNNNTTAEKIDGKVPRTYILGPIPAFLTAISAIGFIGVQVTSNNNSIKSYNDRIIADEGIENLVLSEKGYHKLKPGIISRFKLKPFNELK